MSNSIERPVFFEGQILSANDLNTAVQYGRNQQARHERYLHLWGIAAGLELSGKDKKDAQGKAYVEVTASAGLAIDGWGREIVVPEDVPLSESLFDDLNVAIPDQKGEALYPVFLVAKVEQGTQTAANTGGCDNSQPSREVEGYEITFGRPGEELDIDKQTGAGIADQLDDLVDEKPWRVLLGYVKWGASLSDASKKVSRFIGFEVNPANGIPPRYAGVQADTVAARSGRLLVRTRNANLSDKPALVIDETEGGLLQFGQLTAQGDVTALMSVDSKGNLTVTGKISGAVTPGSVQVQSGVAMDGLLLPLPSGITTEQVEAGKVVLNVQLTPLSPTAPPTLTDTWGAFPLECTTDADRRIRCRIRWFKLSAGPTQIQDLPAPCSYLVIASVPAATGNNP
jgi:hypothetical protein